GLARWDIFSPTGRAFSLGYLISTKTEQNLKVIKTLNPSLNIYAIKNPLPRIIFSKSAKYIPESEMYDEASHLAKTELSPDKEIIIGRIPEKFTLTGGNGKVLSYQCSLQKITAELITDDPVIVFFSEMFYPGWKAFSNKIEYPIIRGNKVFRTIFLPEGVFTGKNKVVLTYDPVSFKFGLLVTLLSIILSVFYFVKYYGKKGISFEKYFK
ncbi:hypothetical protein ACFL58_04345, partial [Elusimicrobiota bacterium]